MLAEIFCDECGRKTDKIHRRYREHGYCGSCYVRVFVKQQCPSCSCIARLPKSIPNAICRSCEAKKPCVRCGLSGKPVGKVCIHGPVCASCSPYFREKEPCEVCSRLSHRLTRVSRFGDALRRCERCAIADHGTCKACHRYRKLDASSDKKLCDLCSTGDVKICQSCGELISAGRGVQCENCYWMQLLEKRTSISVELLESQLLQNEFVGFSKWLGVSSGFNKAALVVSRYALLFQEVDRQWHQFPTYPELLKSLGADYLRRHSKVLEWLQAEQSYFIDETLKKEVAEEHRIQRMLSKVPDKTKAQAVLSQYEKILRCRLHHGKITIQTLRLSMTPAIALMRFSKYELPNTRFVVGYLKDVPGQRASLAGFIVFLRKKYSLKIKLPVKSDSAIAKRQRIERQLVALMQKECGETEFLYWCKHALELFHGLRLPIKTVKRLVQVIERSDGGLCIKYNGEKYFVPASSSTIPVKSLVRW